MDQTSPVLNREPAVGPTTDQQQKELQELAELEELARLEEMAATEGAVSGGQQTEFGPGEAIARTAREAIAGATFEASERLLSEPAVAAYKLLVEGKVDEAKSLLENYDLYRDREWARQEQFEKQNKAVATTAGLIGGLYGTSAKLATAGLKEGMPFLSRMGQAAVTGGVAAGATEAARVAGEAEAPTLPQAAMRIGVATGAGAIASPVIGAGMEAVAQGIGRVMTSGPAMRLLQVLAGPPVRTQKAYLQAIPEIEKLPDETAVVKTFGEIRDRVIEFSEQNADAKRQAEAQIKALEVSIKERAKEAVGENKARLMEAQRELNSIRQHLQLVRVPQAKEQLEIAKAAQVSAREAATAPAPLRPEVDSVLSAIDTMRSQYIEKSQAAAALISDEQWFEKRLVIDAYKEQIKQLKEPGAAFGRPVRNTLAELQREIVDLEKELPDRITGGQVKAAIKQLDKAWETLQASQFGDTYNNALKGVRYKLDSALKEANPEYDKAMEPVRDAAKDLEELEQFFIASKPGATSDKILSRLKQAEKDPVLFEMLEKLEKQSGVAVTAPVRKLQEQAKLKEAPLPVLPEEKQLQDVKLAVALTQAKNFEDQVFSSIADKNLARYIIDIKRQIDIYRNPEFVEAQIREAVASGQLDLAAAQKVLQGHEASRQKMAQAIENIARKGIAKPEDILMTILRAPDGKFEQAAATRMIDALSSLPDESFKDLFEALSLRSASEINNLAKNLRIRESLDRPRTNGSRRAVTIGGFFKGLVDRTSNEPVTRIISSAFSAVGPIVGAYLDEFGGAAAKAYLRNAARLQGIPTGPKFRSFATAPITAKIRNSIAGQMAEMASGIDADQLYGVAETARPAVERDIKQSKMSAVDRARALNELNQLGGVSGKYVRKIMLESAPPVSTPEMKAPSMELEADKPDMLERLSKRTQKTQEQGLRGLVGKLRES